MSRKSKCGPGMEGNGPKPAKPGSQARIDDLKVVPRDRDLVLDNLDAVMGYVIEAALENFEQAKRCGDPDIQAGIVRFAVELSQSYAKLAAARDKHRQMVGG